MAGELAEVRNHWEEEVCGTRYAEEPTESEEYFRQIAETRYRLEPFILPFQDAPAARGKRVLEIGVGAGTDFSQWVQNGALAVGVDLTDAAVKTTANHLAAKKLSDHPVLLSRSNGEQLPFPDKSFHTVYSWGVLHHSPRPELCYRECHRVLEEGGELKLMVYHTRSWVGWLSWIRYGLMRGAPFQTVKQVLFNNMESPGTSTYTPSEIREVLSAIGFREITVTPRLSPGDLLTIKLSKKNDNLLNKIAQRCYPRALIRWLGDRFGFYLLVSARKS
ncbi:methyltransferase domain-containing protein [bacterium]|nr:methyltransferase domain-containing protein [bacterium]